MPRNCFLFWSAAIGVTQFCHPVCDVNINPQNPEIRVRTFGDGPRESARHGEAAVRGNPDAGVVVTAKHFAGRGGKLQKQLSAMVERP
ncbi:MAG: glycoside hydrolase family 3 N-terminal domain-containing protein [Anaerolineales bacterium]